LVVVREVGNFEVSELVPITRIQSVASSAYAVGSGAVRVILFVGFKNDGVRSRTVKKAILSVGFREINIDIPSVGFRAVNMGTPAVGSGARVVILFVGFKTDRVGSGAVKKAILSVGFRKINIDIPSVGSRAANMGTPTVGSGARMAILFVGFKTDRVRSGAVKKAILSVEFRAVNIGTPSVGSGARMAILSVGFKTDRVRSGAVKKAILSVGPKTDKVRSSAVKKTILSVGLSLFVGFRAVTITGPTPSAKPAAAARVRKCFQRPIQRQIQASHFRFLFC
jgi:hypothetical protein